MAFLLGVRLYVIFLPGITWDRIKKFIHDLRDHILCTRKLTSNDKVFTYMEQDYESGKYGTVYGMFNDVKEELIGAEWVQSNQIDDTIRQLHRRSALVIHE